MAMIKFSQREEKIFSTRREWKKAGKDATFFEIVTYFPKYKTKYKNHLNIAG